MGARQPARPSLREIGLAQNEDRNLRPQLAARRFYADAKALHFLGGSISLAFALAAPLFVLLWPKAGPLLGAGAGAWIFISRLLLIPLRDKKRSQGALAQETFDCEVLSLYWNPGLAEPLAHEDIYGAANRAKVEWNAGDWYPTDSGAAWPRSVLICQRSNAVWARRQHGGYGWVVVGFAAAWGVLGIVTALAAGETLATYLATIGLPSLPAFLDASEETRAHFRHSQARHRVESTIKKELATADADNPSALRSIQDQIFLLRRRAPLVPEWFYRLRRQALEADMRKAAEDLAAGDQ